MSDRSAIPRNLERVLFQEVGNRCPICDNDDVSTLTIHHIAPYAEAKSHRREDMLVLCANCHAKAQCGEIGPEELYEAKRMARKVVPLRPRQGSPQIVPPSQTVIGDANIVAGGNVTIQAPRTKGRPRPPMLPGTVATDPYKIGYLRRLARRYQEFKEHEVGKEGMRYAPIYVIYEREMGFSMPNTPLDRFDAACRFLQGRIENTRLGRILKRHQKLYSTFEEFVQKKVQPDND